MAYDSPMYIVTACSDEVAAGCLVAFVTQCSVNPARHIICISVENHTFEAVRDCPSVAVHLVPAGRYDLAAHFGGLTGDEVDKFDGIDWHRGPLGTRILAGVGNWFVADVLAEFVVGDHHAFLLDEVDGVQDPAERALRFRDVAALTPGHLP